ncbi:hypothetical protein IF1G_03218 [Cordyceps javanica]|uniref:Uncharacterized protein n=1 Tax=Cordyceps javanica TaxID=43265 RepID=A0A545W5R9_9HYPO|nr:hypothetical protein IF1G_03218 [Cordyceps javanica]TQW09337.1 hypothetical protein IF2G_03768 [Cordyceps javanica]
MRGSRPVHANSGSDTYPSPQECLLCLRDLKHTPNNQSTAQATFVYLKYRFLMFPTISLHAHQKMSSAPVLLRRLSFGSSMCSFDTFILPHDPAASHRERAQVPFSSLSFSNGSCSRSSS